MCVCVGACRVTMVIEIKGHSSTFGCWCRITSQRWWIPLIETWTILNPYQFNTNVTVLWPSRYAGSCARRFLCMPRHRCQSHRLLGHWPLFAVRQVFLKPFFWSRTVQYKSNWNYGKMTRAFAFLPPFLLPRFAERLGADRVVLGRELSIKEIASVAADVDDLEVEAQCLISHSFWLWAEAHWNLPSTLNWFEGVLADLAVWKRENLLLTKSWLICCDQWEFSCAQQQSMDIRGELKLTDVNYCRCLCTVHCVYLTAGNASHQKHGVAALQTVASARKPADCHMVWLLTLH